MWERRLVGEGGKGESRLTGKAWDSLLRVKLSLTYADISHLSYTTHTHTLVRRTNIHTHSCPFPHTHTISYTHQCSLTFLISKDRSTEIMKIITWKMLQSSCYMRNINQLQLKGPRRNFKIRIGNEACQPFFLNWRKLEMTTILRKWLLQYQFTSSNIESLINQL